MHIIIERPRMIYPGETWRDNRGQPIQAHGGSIFKFGEFWYWFGEDRSPDLANGHRAVACYASHDLMHWEFRRRVVASGPPELGMGAIPYVLERPKVYYHRTSRKFVLYAHLDNRDYSYARVGVYVCDTIDGEYTFLHSFRPLRQESRDIGQFIDDDGSAYLIFEARPTKGFFIAKLSEDYLAVEKRVCFIPSEMEGGALVKFEEHYYLIGSWLSGWKPNPNQYATAASLEGPWSEFKDIAPRETNTYGSQSSFLLKVAGSIRTTVIFLGDIWRPGDLSDSRYLWMPAEIGNGKLQIPRPRPWRVDVKTGEAVC